MSLAKRIEKSWYSRGGFTLLLLPLAWLYGLIIYVRRWCYQSGLWSRPQLPVPVVVVGNLAVGGTGKSPVVGWLVKELRKEGFKPGIVSRGYGGQQQPDPVIVTADADPALYGDEPVMLAEQTHVPVCVCTDRVAAVLALYEQGVDVIVADDGLQHYRMRRTAELVVVDGQRMFGNGQLMPAGPLREPLGRRAEVDAVLINGGQEAGAVRFDLRPGVAVELITDAQRDLSGFEGSQVFAVAGIGNPGRFVGMLEGFGMEVEWVDVADHARVDLSELRQQSPKPIMMTHKDAVKYRGTDVTDVWFVPVELGIDPMQSKELLTQIKAKL